MIVVLPRVKRIPTPVFLTTRFWPTLIARALGPSRRPSPPLASAQLQNAEDVRASAMSSPCSPLTSEFLKFRFRTLKLVTFRARRPLRSGGRDVSDHLAGAVRRVQRHVARRGLVVCQHRVRADGRLLCPEFARRAPVSPPNPGAGRRALRLV